MVRSKCGVPFLLALTFSVMLALARGKLHHNLSTEMGLTPSCVNRVIATCASSFQSPNFHAPVEKDCAFTAEIGGVVEAFKESSTGHRTLLQSLNEWLGKNAMQEKSLNAMESDMQAVKEIVSQSMSGFQNLNKTLQDTIFNSFKEWQKSKIVEKSFLENMNAQTQSIGNLVKTNCVQDSALTAMKTSLSQIEQKMAEIQQDFQSMKKSQEEEVAKLGRSISEIKNILENNSKIQPLLPESTTVGNYEDHPRNCAELFRRGNKESGVQIVFPFSCCKNMSISVYCDQTTDGGGWTVFQRRDALPKREHFFRTWEEYQRGFGNLTGEFWLGLDNIHALASNGSMELRVDLEDFDGEKRWAKYNDFSIDDSASKYRFHIGTYSGDAGDSLKYHNGSMFSTKDNDNDSSSSNCAEKYHGAWWYKACHYSSLNGLPHEGKHESKNDDGIAWFYFRGNYYSLKKATMKMRPEF